MKVIIQLLCGGVQFQVKIPWNKTIILSEINTKMSSDVKIVLPFTCALKTWDLCACIR